MIYYFYSFYNLLTPIFHQFSFVGFTQFSLRQTQSSNTIAKVVAEIPSIKNQTFPDNT